MEAITEDMTVGDIVNKYPEVVEPLADYGIHCVGCHASPYEPIGMGLRGHGVDDAKVKEIIEHLNNLVQKRNQPKEEKKESLTGSIEITDAAVTKAKKFLEAEGKEGFNLRFSILPGGCSGSTYDLRFDDNITSDDKVIEKNGLKIVINSRTLEKADGLRIDYQETLQGSGFKIDNPNATSSCGCGSSFN